jgi:hypothetical protein
MEQYTDEELDRIIEEISGYEVELEPDPTLPTLGINYINSKIQECRNYTNRVQSYLLRVNNQRKNLDLSLKTLELDIEFKTAELLAENEVVRMQASISDRNAVAKMKLRDEYEQCNSMKILRENLEQTAKIIKMKYDDLNRTNSDIKTQNQLVKRHEMINPEGEGNERNKDKTTAGNLAPPVKTVEAPDILEGSTELKRTPDVQTPAPSVNESESIKNFLSGSSAPINDEPVISDNEVPDDSESMSSIYADLLKD